MESIGALKKQKEAEEDQQAGIVKRGEKLHKDLQTDDAYYEQKDALMEKAREEARAIVESKTGSGRSYPRFESYQMEKGRL